MAENRFERRYIAFVDILGFSSLVVRMSHDNRLFSSVRGALTELDRKSRDFKSYRTERRQKRVRSLLKGLDPLVGQTNLQMTAFSDCYVLSEISPSWHVLAAVQALGSRFLREGILTRGAVVRGDAYHNGRVLFGPGIIEAHKLESEVAKYPRIIVTEEVRRDVWGYHQGRWNGRLFKRDVDGFWFLNLLTPSLSNWAQLTGSASDRAIDTHLKAVRRSLTRQWKQVQGNPNHMSKVGWLINKFNSVARKEGVKPLAFLGKL